MTVARHSSLTHFFNSLFQNHSIYFAPFWLYTYEHTHSEDGPGGQVVFYFAITAETMAAFKDLKSASPAVKLWAEYCANQVDTLRHIHNYTNVFVYMYV